MTIPVRVRQSLMVTALMGVTSCKVPSDSHLPALTFDSAESKIVVNTQPERPAEWSVDPTPMFRVGVASGSSMKEFHDIRGATRLPDGRIAVLDGGSGQLRMFSPGGTP